MLEGGRVGVRNAGKVSGIAVPNRCSNDHFGCTSLPFSDRVVIIIIKCPLGGVKRKDLAATLTHVAHGWWPILSTQFKRSVTLLT